MLLRSFLLLLFVLVFAIIVSLTLASLFHPLLILLLLLLLLLSLQLQYVQGVPPTTVMVFLRLLLHMFFPIRFAAIASPAASLQTSGITLLSGQRSISSLSSAVVARVDETEESGCTSNIIATWQSFITASVVGVSTNLVNEFLGFASTSSTRIASGDDDDDGGGGGACFMMLNEHDPLPR